MAINLELRADLPEEAVVFDKPSYDNAIIGVTTDNKVVYDFDKMVEELMHDEGWSYNDSVDWIEFNTIRSLPYTGTNGPAIMYRLNWKWM